MTNPTRHEDAAAAPRLLSHHAAELAASAIALDVVAARGYRSVTEADVLAALGFADYQCSAPGMLVPIHNTAGRVVTHQYKPDRPRLGPNGKPIKYESPKGSTPVLDVPPAVRPVLRDPSVPLVVTEGSKKADSGVSRGMHVVSISGVYGWRSRNDKGGRVTISDWDDVALDGRHVSLIFDSDLSTNSNVRDALNRLRNMLVRRGANVQIVYLPPGPSGEKIGLDDYFANGGTVQGLGAVEAGDVDAVNADAWPPLEPFADPARPSFPLDALPPEMRRFVVELSTETQTPPDLAAMTGLSVVSAAAGNAYEVHVRGGWVEPPNLYVTVVLPPGERKSAVFARVRSPLDAIEREEQERARTLISAGKEQREIDEQRLIDLRKRAVRTKSTEEREALSDEAVVLKQRIEADPAPVLPRLSGDDATTEIIAVRMAEQGGAFAVLSAEGGTVMAIAAGLYTGGTPNLDVLLKGHAGDRLAVDRMGRPSITVERPCLTIGLSPQPNVLVEAGQVTQMRDRGLLARFLYALPVSQLGHRLMEPPVMPEAVARDWSHTVRRVFGLRAGTDDSSPTADAGDPPIPRRVCLCAAAGRALTAFRQEIEVELREGGELEPLRDWASKLPGAVVRIAGLFHAMRVDRKVAPWDLELGNDDMERAILIAREYLIPHARAAFALMGRDDPTNSAARRIWRWASALPADHFTTRDACRRYRDLKVGDLTAGLDELAERGYVRRLPDPPAGPRPGRPPSPSWEIRPDDADGSWDETDTTTSRKGSVRFVPSVPEDYTGIRSDGRGEVGDPVGFRDGVDGKEWIEL